jgi:hypothetical protein
MADESIQCHDDTSTCDTVSSLTVPIVFVPGVMGSRLDIIQGRTWDPDDSTAMATWISLTDASVQKTRRALRASGSGAPGTAAKVKNTLYHSSVFTDPIDQVFGASRCRAIGKLATGKDEKPSIGVFYGTHRNWGSVNWGFYGSLLMYLESQLNAHDDDPHFPVFACGYDWRQSNTISGRQINAFLRKVLNQYKAVASNVIVITHSMGGLAVRAGIQADPGITSSIRGVIHGLQPSLGAVTCYRRFLTGASAPADKDGIGPDYVLNKIMGNTGARYAYNLSGCAGPLQLLPNHLFSSCAGSWLQGLDGSYDLSAIYTIYRQINVPGIAGITAGGEEQSGTTQEKKSRSVRADFAFNIKGAEAFHQALERTAHPRTYVLYSTGLRTDHSIEFQNLFGSISAPDSRPKVQWQVEGVDGADLTDLWNEVVYHRRPDGDGTVPEASAQCPTLMPLPLAEPAAAARPLEHAAAYGDAAFQALTLSFIHRLLTPG